MSVNIERFTATLRGLGGIEALSSSDAPGLKSGQRPRNNAHVHLPPNFTAFETTHQALGLAEAQDMQVLGASNYYDYSVYADFAGEAMARGIYPLFGLEIISLIDTLVQSGVKINDPGNPGKMYLCGKGITRFDPMDDDARRLLQVIREQDSARMAAVTGKLAGVFAAAGIETGLDADAIKGRVASRHQCARESVYLQERHIAQAFQEVFFDKVPEGERLVLLARVFGTATKAQPGDAVTIQNDIRSFLMKAGMPAFVPDTFVDFDHAYRLVLALGGMPCYPMLADGASPITQYEADINTLIADLKDRGVPCAEFIPLRNAPEVLSRYVHAMHEAGMVLTAGTEHNTLDLLPLEPVCVDSTTIADDLQEIFWEGACVVAAHQYLTFCGQPGFVDTHGTLNPAFASSKSRIEHFRTLGEIVISRYRDACRAL